MAKLKDILLNEFQYPFSGDKYLILGNDGVIRVSAAEDYTNGDYSEGDYLVSLGYLEDYVANNAGGGLTTVGLSDITVTGTAGKLIKVNSSGNGLEVDTNSYLTTGGSIGISQVSATNSSDYNNHLLTFSNGQLSVLGAGNTGIVQVTDGVISAGTLDIQNITHPADEGDGYQYVLQTVDGVITWAAYDPQGGSVSYYNGNGLSLNGTTFSVDQAYFSGFGSTTTTVSGGLQAVMSGVSGLLKNSNKGGQSLSAVVSKGYVDETYTVTGFNIWVNPAWISGGNTKSTGLSGGLCAVMAGISSSISSSTANRTPASGVSLMLSTRLSGDGTTTNSTITGFSLYVNPSWLSSSSSGGAIAVSSFLKGTSIGSTVINSVASTYFSTSTGSGVITGLASSFLIGLGGNGTTLTKDSNGTLTWSTGGETDTDTWYQYDQDTSDKSLTFGTQTKSSKGGTETSVTVKVNPSWISGQGSTTYACSGGLCAIMNGAISSSISANAPAVASGLSLKLSAVTTNSRTTGYRLYVNPDWLSSSSSGGAIAVSSFLKGTSIGSGVVTGVISSYLKPTSAGSGAITGTISSYLSTTAAGSSVITGVTKSYLTGSGGSGTITGVISSYLKESSAGSAAITGAISTYLKNTSAGSGMITGLISSYLSTAPGRCGAYTMDSNKTYIYCNWTNGDYLTAATTYNLSENKVYTLQVKNTIPVGKGLIVRIVTTSGADGASIKFANTTILTINGGSTYYLGFVGCTGSGSSTTYVDFIGYKKIVRGSTNT